MGTAANMGIEENLALAYRRGKEEPEMGNYRKGGNVQEQLKWLELGLEDRLTDKVGLYRRPARFTL